MTRQLARFGPFEVDLRSRELRKDGVRVRLQEQPFQILTMLLERAGDVVTREEIRDRLWPDGTFVDFEHSMNAAIKRLRAALGDTAESPKFVETLHRRGYRFIAAAEQPDVPAKPLDPGSSALSRPRLVVLPFANLGTDTPDYFSDGLTEEMIMQLGRRCADRIGVLARTSSMLYKNVIRAASDIGEQLRADYLVEGSVRRDGDRVRITAQLIETKGETHLWANSYDRTMADCLAVQTEVATEIAVALASELIPVRAANWTSTRHPGAYQAFLRARFNWNKDAGDGLLDAIAGYDESIALDASYGKAYSGRARARLALSDYNRVEPRAALEAARADACHALTIDPGDADAHLVVGEVERTLDWNWAGAEAAYRAALAANPNSEAALRYYAVFLAARGRAESVVLGDRACAIDPLCLTVNSAAASVHYFRGDYGAASRRYRQVLAIEPRHVLAGRGLSACFVQNGEYDKAIELLTSHEQVRRDAVAKAWLGHALAVSGARSGAEAIVCELLGAHDHRFVPPFHLAMVYAALGEIDAAFGQLDRACDVRDPSLDTLAVEPRFQLLHRDRRYHHLLERLRLAPLAAA
jgi:TolB-like protein/tetratricopeptide (TPR) repeat protein